MNPTLWDVSRRVRCRECGIVTRVDESLLNRCAQLLAVKNGASIVRCWHCGIAITSNDVSDWLALPVVPPQTVKVIQPLSDEVTAGELVLVVRQKDATKSVQVKRVIALPGQTVSIDATGRLLVDHQRPRFESMPCVLVDSDRHRAVSRWRNGSGWRRTPERSWSVSEPATWLVYEHHSVYRGTRPMPIQDDYPGNVGVQRKLSSADGLSVEFEIAKPPATVSEAAGPNTATPTVAIAVAFWTEDGVRVTQLRHAFTDEESNWTVQAHQAADRASSVPFSKQLVAPELSPTRPIAISVCQEEFKDGFRAWHISNLRVRRDMQYRLTAANQYRTFGSHPTTRDSLELPPDQYFVAGDNVPLSIDSRMWGCVEGSELVGRVVDCRDATSRK